MAENNSSRDLRTEAIVLRRTNYGEADRILTLITPEGKKSVLAKGVRRERSRLAAGIEMFSWSEVVMHKGRGELLVLTAAKPKCIFSNILKDLRRLEVAGEILKLVARAAEHLDNPEHFKVTLESLEALDKEADVVTVQAWFYFNLARVSGEQMNLRFDVKGEALAQDANYVWDTTERALRVTDNGTIGADAIKVMRLMWTAKLELILRIKGIERVAPELIYIAKSLNQL